MHTNWKDHVRRAKRLMRQVAGRDLRYGVQTRVAKLTLGSEYGRHCVCPEGLTAESVVYSFGTARDITFDLAMIDRFGVEVHAFDISPIAIAWIREQSVPDRFHFHEFGVLDYDGIATLQPPVHEGWESYSVLPTERRPVDNEADAAVQGEVYRLATILERLGHDHIDVLKMDIEGAEYAVIEDMLASGLDVRQLLVELHHCFEGLKKSENLIRLLNEHGYRIFDISAAGEDLAFIRVDGG